ncbi:MAG: translocation/assembly module TamB domain-containing protein [Bacteroidales bacterium]|nr:translocation/assembly module TamB domain-containing protein [Bacteroidales bacterium]
MKRWMKIVLAVLATIVALIVGAVVLVQIPSVQKKIADKVAEKISEKTGLDVSVGDIHLSLLERVILEDVKIANGQDTVLTCGKAALTISPLSIIKGDYIINRLALENGSFYPGNLPEGDKGNKEDEEDKPFSLPQLKARVDHLLVDNFKVVNHKEDAPHVDRGKEQHQIDFNDMEITDLHLDAKDIKYYGKEASLKVKKISMNETVSGTKLNNLSFDATYDESGAHVTDLNLDDGHTNFNIKEANLMFDSLDDLAHFQDSVYMDVSFHDSLLDLSTLQHYLPDVSFLALKLWLDGRITGTLEDLRTKNLMVRSGTRETFLDVDAHISGLSDPLNAMASIKVNRSRTNTKDIAEIVSQCTPAKNFDKKSISKLAPGTQFSFTGSLNGFFEDFVAYGKIDSPIGGGKVDIICRTDGKDKYDVLGFMDVEDFDLGHFLQNKSLGKATCHASLSSIFGPKADDTELYVDELTIPKFEFNGYTYSNISGAGNYLKDEFELRLVSADPNLKFMAQAILAPSSASGNSLYHVKLSLGHADLAALGFDKRDVSSIRLNALADLTQTPDGRLMGKITVRDIQCRSMDGTFPLGDIEAVTFNGNDRSMLSINSSMFRARYRGTSFVTDIIPQIEALALIGKLDNLARRMEKMPQLGSDRFDLSFKALDTKNLLGYLAPGVHVESGTSLALHSPGDSTGTLQLKSGLLAINNIFVQDLAADMDFYKTSSNAKIGAQMVRVGDVALANDVITANCSGNSALVDYSFCNDPDSLESGHLKAMLSFPNLKESNQKMLVHLGHSFLKMGGEQWNIDPSSVYYADKHIAIHDFSLYNKDQGLDVDGVLSGSNADTCSFNVRNLNLALANLLMKNPLNISGTLTADGKVTGAFARPDVFADVAVDSLSLAGEEIGRIEAKSSWDDTLHRVNLLAKNIIGGREALTATGWYRPDNDKVNALLTASKFNLGLIEPFITDLATDVSGTLTGNVSVTGTLQKPDISATNAHLEQFAAKLDYTQVPYLLDGYVDLSSKKIVLHDFTVKDMERGTGTLSGVITHDHFKDFNIGLNINARNLIGFDTDYTDNDTFYGKSYATGSVGINGPLNALALIIDVSTGPNTVVNIPLKGSATSSTSIITFVDNRPVPRMTAIDSLINLNRVKVMSEEKSGGNGISVYARVRANDNAELNLELDSANGDALHVNGNGVMDLTVKDGDFSIKGDYTISSGDYRLALMGLVTRDFTLNPGSKIHFNGDIMQSELDLTASYKTKAAINPLLATSEGSALRRPVDCGVRITSKLSNPALGFNIRIDDLDPSTQALIDDTLNTEEKRMRQFLALLISGSFIPDEQSGIVNNTSVTYFNATEIMSSQLNSILQQLNIPFDLGFNYQPTESGKDLFDVAVSTQLMNNRVSVNGNIGNRRYLTSNRDDIVGDIDVEIKLDRRGKTRLKLFSHSADEYSNYLDQTQRNGAGISYQEEFNSFKELFRKRSRKDKKKDVPPEGETPSQKPSEN